MRKTTTRNFDCPESGERCVNPKCTATICIDEIRARNQSQTAQENRERDTKYDDYILEPLFGVEPKSDDPKNSN